MKEKTELDIIAGRLKMLSYRMGLKDARRLESMAAELYQVAERVPEGISVQAECGGIF